MQQRDNSPKPKKPGPGGTGPRGTGPGTEPPKRTSRIPPWLFGVILIGLIGWYAYNIFGDTGTVERNTVPYSAIRSQITAGNVERASVGVDSIDADLTQSVLVNDDGQIVPPNTAGSTTGTTRVRAELIPGEDQSLILLLEQNGVEFSGEPDNNSIWTGILFSFAPLLLFVALIVFMGRQMSRGQQNVFGFGRSKARQHDPERPQVTFADVAGEDEAKTELMEVVDFLRNPAKYHSLGARLPRGVLLVGPPGTGKTLTARAVAGEAGVPFFSVSASEFVEMFVGVGASRVRDLFEKAKTASPAIIFVDELDAVGRQRFAGLGGSNDEREQTLNQLLVEMDGFETSHEVIVMAATNRPDVLDPALLRPGRFDRQVVVGLPDRIGREAILTIHSRGIPLARSVDLLSIARGTTGFSGADLANLVNEAALTAARRNRKEILPEDFEEALDKILLGTAKSGLMNAKEREVVAYHEAGHAIVAHFTPGADPLRKVSIVPRGRALGVTVQMPEEDRHNYSRTYLLGRLAMMLGGRAAEMVVYDEVTTGAENDLKEATSLARRMVGLWGMSLDVGPIYLGTGEEHVFLGREITQDKAYSDATAQRLDGAVRDIIEGGLDRALAINQRFRKPLDDLVAALLERETLDGKEVSAVLGPPTKGDDPEVGMVPRQPITVQQSLAGAD
ncbi:MAG: ATP-dependent zinc metalloprotease FtsH [Chloroflexota bacterium]|nr:ATP-dependent zinc metalloprotease FtsH [Chloroflexia bacterium]MDQ3168302.1 ATP-dependent zinc metalloprotease FtsH [Chloroflexota bacterium]MDQ3515024.1 ATP-dependent zinc metalloprotease FtsH [Chloroflexota bacterium]